jgi:hypothetical protein
MSFPLADWQFWVVTASAAVALWSLVRPFLARAPRGACGSCNGCAKATLGARAPVPEPTRLGRPLLVLHDEL